MEKNNMLKLLNENKSFYTKKEIELLKKIIQVPGYEETYRIVLAFFDESNRSLNESIQINRKVRLGLELTEKEREKLWRKNSDEN